MDSNLDLVWLRTTGRAVELLVAVDGEWRLLCSEHFCDNCTSSRIFKAGEVANAPIDVYAGLEGFLQDMPQERQ